MPPLHHSPWATMCMAPCSWAFASTVSYSLGVLQTEIHPLTSSNLPSLLYGFVPILQDKSSCIIPADICQRTRISQAPHEICSPASPPILLLKLFQSYPDSSITHMSSPWKIDQPHHFCNSFSGFEDCSTSLLSFIAYINTLFQYFLVGCV